MKFNKKGQGLSNTWLLVIGVVLLLVFVPQTRIWEKEAATVTTPRAQPTTPGASALCPLGVNIEDVTVTFGKVEEAFNPTVNPETTENLWHRIFQNGKGIGLKQDETSITMDVGDVVAIYYAENASTAGAAYYAAKQEFVVPCDGGEVTTNQMKDSEAYKLYSGNNVTIEVLNKGGSNGGDVNSGAKNQTFGAGDAKTLFFSIDGSFRDAFSPYGKIITVVDVNGSAYDDIEITNIVSNGVAYVPTNKNPAVPKSYSELGTDSDTYVFELPGCISTCRIEGGIAVDVDNILNPDTSHDITLTLFDEDYYLDSETGVMDFGANNDQDADVGYVNQVVTISVD